MMRSFSLLDFRREIIEHNIILSFEGKMSQGVLISLVDTLKQKLKSEGDDSKNYMFRKIFAIFVELAQNIQNHSNENMLIEGHETGVGIIVIREDDNHFILTSGNNMRSSNALKLKQYCDFLNHLGTEELKHQYKQQLRCERNEDAKGAGIGLIEIVRKSGHPLKYEMQPLDQDNTFFTLSVNLSKAQ